MLTEINKCKIVKKYIRRNRWYVQLSLNEHTKAIPQSIYVWLKHNPAFKSIPHNYVIHHLDNDPLNDDPSNLVLMNKYQHTAYHLKYKNLDVPISLDETMGFPIYKPKVYYRKDRKRYYICCRVKTLEGIKIKHITNYNKKHFETKEEAVKAIKKIWPFIETEWKIN